MEGNNFWERIDSATRKDYSRKQLAADAGVSLSAISMWKTRGSFPTADVAVRLAKALNSTVEYLVNGRNIERERLLECLENPDILELVETAQDLESRRIKDLKNIANVWIEK